MADRDKPEGNPDVQLFMDHLTALMAAASVITDLPLKEIKAIFNLSEDMASRVTPIEFRASHDKAVMLNAILDAALTLKQAVLDSMQIINRDASRNN